MRKSVESYLYLPEMETLFHRPRAIDLKRWLEKEKKKKKKKESALYEITVVVLLLNNSAVSRKIDGQFGYYTERKHVTPRRNEI